MKTLSEGKDQLGGGARLRLSTHVASRLGAGAATVDAAASATADDSEGALVVVTSLPLDATAVVSLLALASLPETALVAVAAAVDAEPLAMLASIADTFEAGMTPVERRESPCRLWGALIG